jgi:hypothetical protein
MSVSLRNVQSVMFSLVGALMLSSLCLSAALGPVPVI